MQWLMKRCARGALGLSAAALLLTGVPVLANPVSDAPDATSRESQPCLLAQTTAKPGETGQVEKRRQEEQRQKAAKEKQQVEKSQQPQPRRMMRKSERMPEVAPEAKPSAPPSKRFGAGVVRHGDPGDTGEAE